MMSYSSFRLLQRRDGVARHLDLDVFRYSELDAVIFESHYRTVNPAMSDDLVPCLQVVDHLLELLLPAPRRQKNDQVKNGENEESAGRNAMMPLGC